MSDHLVQKGPTFPQPLDMTIDGRGNVTVRYTDDHGEPKVETDHFDMPHDVANGVILTLLKIERPAGRAAEIIVVCGHHTEAALGEAGGYRRWAGTLLNRRDQPHGDALRAEGRHRRRVRPPRPALREAAA